MGGERDPLWQRGQRRWQASRILPSPLAPKAPIHFSLCSGTDPLPAMVGVGMFVCVWVCDGDGGTEREGTSRQEDDHRKRHRLWKKRRELLKRRMEKVPLWAVYMTDHQRNSQDNRAKRIHNTTQCGLKEKRHWCYEYTCPSRLHLPTYPLLDKRNPIVIFLRQNKTWLSRGGQI